MVLSVYVMRLSPPQELARMFLVVTINDSPVLVLKRLPHRIY